VERVCFWQLYLQQITRPQSQIQFPKEAFNLANNVSVCCHCVASSKAEMAPPIVMTCVLAMLAVSGKETLGTKRLRHTWEQQKLPSPSACGAGKCLTCVFSTLWLIAVIGTVRNWDNKTGTYSHPRREVFVSR